MGFSLRKSFKIGKNTRINLSSKGGVGISTGIKGARVSINKKGAKTYGGIGPIRYQKQIYSSKNNGSANNSRTSNAIENESYQYQEQMPKKRIIRTFFKKYYKEVIVVIIGIIIGSSIGSIGKVAPSEVESVNAKIQGYKYTLESKENELDALNNSIKDLEGFINN